MKKGKTKVVHYKQCSHCNEVLPLSEFHSAKTTGDGLGYICKTCTSNLARESRARIEKERPFYGSWKAMMEICHRGENWNFNRDGKMTWDNFGGRGIEVSEEFREYEAFAAYANQIYQEAQVLYGPKVKLILDRIDVNGHFERGNLRFVSGIESGMNRRVCQVDQFEHVGPNGRITLPISWWARIYSIDLTTVLGRMKKGWDIARALNEPVNKKFHPVESPTFRQIDEVLSVDEAGEFYVNGFPTSLNQISKKYGVHNSTIWGRLKRGMSLQEAVTLIR